MRSVASRARILMLVAGLATGATAAAPEWRESYLAALRACKDQDYTACRERLSALRPLMPGHPTLVYTLARASAHLGDRRGALRELRTLAAMGLGQDVQQDDAFASLRSDGAFARIARRMKANLAPRTRSSVLHRFAESDLLAEDVAWDPQTERWLVSSIRERTIVAVDATGRESDFIPRVGDDSAGDTIWGIFALGVDATRRRLWASTAATHESPGGAGSDDGRTALLCYGLDDARLIRRLELPRSGEAHVLGDLTLGPDGSVYITDSAGGGVYRASIDAGSLETLLPPGNLNSPQTPVLLPNRDRLLIPDYSRGIAALDLKTRRLSWLRQPRDLAAAGIDGLYDEGGSALVAIQNGTEPRRVLELTLDAAAESVTAWRVLEQASPWLGEPNHGVIRKGLFVLIGNSGWDRVQADGRMADDPSTRPPVLLSLPLRGAAPDHQ